MSKAGELVPITREYLAAIYEKHPIDPPNPASLDCLASMKTMLDAAVAAHPPLGEARTHKDYAMELPHKIDESLFRVRQQNEELAALSGESEKWSKRLEKLSSEDSAKLAPLLAKLSVDSEATRKHVFDYQTAATLRVKSMIDGFMPKDFRATIVARQSAKKETANAAKLKAAKDSGASIKEQYDLAWAQQMERREQLAAIGNASGVYKILIKLVGGVPDVLLDFAKAINHPEGPMEEMRVRYAPNLRHSLELVWTAQHALRCAAMILDTDKDIEGVPASSSNEAVLSATSLITLSARAQALHKEFMEWYTPFLSKLWDAAPFFVTAEQLASGKGAAGTIEMTVAARDSYEALAHAPKEGLKVSWDFSIAKHDLAFSVRFVAGAADSTPDWSKATEIVAESRVQGSTSGSHTSTAAGFYSLTWNNSHSMLTSKKLSYNVDVEGEGNEDEEK